MDEEAGKGDDRKTTTSKSGLALNGISYFMKAENRKEWRTLVVISQTTGWVKMKGDYVLDLSNFPMCPQLKESNPVL